VALTLSHLKAGSYRLLIQRTGYRANDPLSAYIDMGMPSAQPRQLPSYSSRPPTALSRTAAARGRRRPCHGPGDDAQQ
jgi:beta-xylosidase